MAEFGVNNFYDIHERTSKQSFTFTVSRVGVEFEASLTQAQERAISVETLALDAHIVFTAFIHIYGTEKEKRKADSQER